MFLGPLGTLSSFKDFSNLVIAVLIEIGKIWNVLNSRFSKIWKIWNFLGIDKLFSRFHKGFFYCLGFFRWSKSQFTSTIGIYTLCRMSVKLILILANIALVWKWTVLSISSQVSSVCNIFSSLLSQTVIVFVEVLYHKTELP